MPIYCVVPACGAISVPGGPRMFHLLPKDPQLCREWLEAVGLNLRQEEVMKKRLSYRLCSDHFEESSYETKLCLRLDARPTMRARRGPALIGPAPSVNISVAESVANVERVANSVAYLESLADSVADGESIADSVAYVDSLADSVADVQRLADTESLTGTVTLADNESLADTETLANTETLADIETIADNETIADTETVADSETNTYDTNMRVQKEYLEILDDDDQSERDSTITAMDMQCEAETYRSESFADTETVADNETIADTDTLADTETNTYDTNMRVQKEYLEICDDDDQSEKDSVRTEMNMQCEAETNRSESLCNVEANLKQWISNERFLEYCDDFLGVKPLKFIKCQMLLRSRNKKTGDVKFKRFCLNLYHHNPQAYAILQKFVGLPSIKLLRRTYISIYPGYITPQCLQLLEMIVGRMNAKDRCCVAGIGSTSLKKHLYYDIRNDKIHGLHHVDDKPMPKAAKRAFVLIVKGMFSAWRLPVAYALFGAGEGCARAAWADTVLQTLLHKGLDVRAFIADHGDDNSKRASQLQRINASYFVILTKRIYYIFDVRRLVRSLRDSLLTYDFRIGEDVVKWDHILSFYNAEVELQTQLVPRLTGAHVDPDAAQRARTALAAQLFSRSLAAAMALFLRLKLLADDALATIKLIGTVNDAFDILNSNTIQHDTQFKRAYKGEKWQKKFLNETIDYFQTIKRDTNGDCVGGDIEAIDGFIVTMRSVMNLWRDLSKDGYGCLFTRNLSIQFVDDFFRRLNFQKKKPQMTSIQFNRLLYKSLIGHVIETAKLNSAEAISPTLALLSEYVADEAAADRPGADSSSLAVGEPDYRISLPDTNAIQFIAGYLMRKALDKHRSCQDLMKYLNPSESETKEDLYINFEYFEEHSETPKSLKLPVEFIAFVVKMEERFLEVFQGEKLPREPGAALMRAAADLVVLPCSCFPLFLIKKLFVRLRIYNALKIVNRQFQFNVDSDGFEIIKLDL